MAPTAIAAGAVHVWEADLRDVPAAAIELLSPAERARARAIVAPAPARLWPRSRALLRLLLARYSGLAAEQLTLLQGAHGKPLLAGGERLRFNLSHSGPLALYAISAEQEVGVDVERAGRRADEFLRAWTRREAAGKCLGSGLVGGTGLRLGASAPGAGAGRPGGEAPQAEPWLCELELRERALGALACRRQPAAVERFSWRP